MNEPQLKRPRMSLDILNDDENVDTESFASLEVEKYKTFKPICLLADWLEPRTTTKRLSLVILLPSGIGKGDFTARVAEGGQTFRADCFLAYASN